ncbi:Membrane protein involved in the export of O-antigen and teichoic acid [Paenibacillus catalpae]|uniref:Membrane protein involved in the export of O-antigen and teichoic acid n=1 Tax=Paenibacillus catalpae TaxID=1045775 RepID=A0A1I2DUD0_9BACL|nr:flippase [Paenibacillus catalpae]SFE84028.1 Membrane protein involved in the export of O-antigen and teichoic acid [Paenibacillus catalpae]
MIVKNYIYNILYQVFAMLVPVITAPYLARVLGASNQGIYSYVNSVTYIISILTLLGIYSYGNRQIAYERDNRSKMSQTFWEIMFLRIILTLVGTCIFIIIAIMYKTYTIYFLIYYLYLLAQYIDCTWIFVGLEDMKVAVIKNAVTKIISTIGIFLFVKNSNDVGIYLLILGLSVLVSNLLAFTQLRIYVEKPKIKINNIVLHLKGSLKLFLPMVATLLYLQLGKVMIEYFTKETSQLSYYDNAEKIVTVILTLITALSTVMMPRIANEYSKGNNQKVQDYLIKSGKFSVFLAFPMTFGLIVIAKSLVPWYLGDDFLPVIYGIMIISPIIIAYSLEGISGRQYFTATNQTKILTVAYTTTAIFNFVINIILIPIWGYLGAAIATLVSSYITILIQYVYLNKQIPINNLLKSCRNYFFYSVGMCFIVFIISYRMAPTIITTIIQILVGAAAYLILCFFAKDEMYLEMVKWVRKRIKKNSEHN